MEASFCMYCQKRNLTVKIKCTTCNDYELCVQCFACGVETGAHKKEHDYQVTSQDDGGVFVSYSQWAGYEEESLLDAIEHYGFGNWEDVATNLKSRTVEECREHYTSYYLQGNIGKATLPNQLVNKVSDHSNPDGGPLSPSLSMPLKPVELSVEEQHELGYMPLRDDFEKEYDNEAESIISNLAVNYDDDDLDIAFKLAQVDIYRQRLVERNRRKWIAHDYGLIHGSNAMKKKSLLNRKLCPNEEHASRIQRQKLRIFAQFQTHAEHEKFLLNLQKERRIRQRIKELIRYRKNGITKLTECARFEAERIRREKHKAAMKKMANSGQSTSSISDSTKHPMAFKKKEKNEDLHTTNDENKPQKRRVALISLPGYDLLSQNEKQLCEALHFMPQNYITIKACIIKNNTTDTEASRIQSKCPPCVSRYRWNRIVKFLADNGWISSIPVP